MDSDSSLMFLYDGFYVPLLHVTEKLDSFIIIIKVLLTAVDSILGVKSHKNILIIWSPKIIIHKKQSLKLEWRKQSKQTCQKLFGYLGCCQLSMLLEGLCSARQNFVLDKSDKSQDPPRILTT